jgi:hypothetical protein
MADLFSNPTDKAELDASQVEEWAEGVIIAARESASFLPDSDLISQKVKKDAAIGTFIKFAQNDAATTALTDGEEITSTAKYVMAEAA